MDTLGALVGQPLGDLPAAPTIPDTWTLLVGASFGQPLPAAPTIPDTWALLVGASFGQPLPASVLHLQYLPWCPPPPIGGPTLM